MALFSGASILSSVTRTAGTAAGFYKLAHVHSAAVLGVVVAILSRAPARQDAYNVLWAVVFGFATLNILSLAARRFEPGRRGLSFGELLAVMVVLISVFLLGWEMLNLFHIFPIKLQR